MDFQIRQTRPANLREAMEAAHNYENSAQSLRKAVRQSEKKDKEKGKKEDRKDRRRRKFSDLDSDSESSDSDESDSASSGSEEERSQSPRRWSHHSKGAREKAIVKVKTEDPEQRRMMSYQPASGSERKRRETRITCRLSNVKWNTWMKICVGHHHEQAKGWKREHKLQYAA
jgi:hypothetical protein